MSVAMPVREAGHEAVVHSERHSTLFEWNATAHSIPAVCLHECFERQVQLHPDAPAVVCGGEFVTFRELNLRANRLAHYLRAKGVGPEALAAICVERSLEMVVGVLAVLKAGGAYVPLDPGYPAERLAFMLGDSSPVVVLTHGPARAVLAEAIAGLTAAPTVIDLDDSQWEQQPGHDIGTRTIGLDTRSLAYVIYTSGSTGRPKGVMNEHGAVVNRLLWMVDTHPIGARDAVLQKTSFSFDVSVWEIFWPLMSGTRLVLAEPRGHQDPDYLAELIVREQITRAHFVPSMLSLFLESKGAPACSNLLDVFCSGEELSEALAQRFAQRLPNTRLHNLYGPTEAAIEVTAWTWDSSSAAERSVPIGRPIWNARIYLLDGKLEPVPVGAAGGLFIGGAPVARGYLHRPELTAERFIDDPFIAGGRLYKSGDLACFRPDGAIVFLGRDDEQVKIRGFRVELGEIEARLASVPGVASAAVTVREGTAGDRRLVAYFTLLPGDWNFEVAALRAHLGGTLPGYMMPSAFVRLPTMPLTASGKLDRKALPAPPSDVQAEASYEEPLDAVEQTLARVWARVLGTARVGRNQDFFALGGDSILAIQVVYQAKQDGLKLAPRQIFRHPTVAALARHARPIVRLEERVASSGDLPLLPIQRRFFEHDPVNVHHYHQSCLVRAPQGMDEASIREAFRALCSRHDALRLRFDCSEGQWRARFADFDESMLTEAITIERVDAVEPSDALVTRKCIEAQSQIDIVRGPLFRVVLFVGSTAQSPLLFVVLHHLIVDGVSWRILLDHLRVGSGARTSSYQEWARALETFSASPSLAAELPYWTSVWSTPTDPLPVDRVARDDLRQSSTRVRLLSWNESETARLLTACQDSYGAGAHELLLTSLLIALFRWKGIRSVRVGMEGHGREEDSVTDDSGSQLDLSQTIGWFTTYFPVLLALPEDASTSARAVEAVKQQWRSVPRKGLGYGVLRYLRADENLIRHERAHPLGITFNYLGQIDNRLEREQDFSRVLLPPTGADFGPERRRETSFGLNGGVLAGRLTLALDYSVAEYDEQTVDAFAGFYEQALREIISAAGEATQGPEAVYLITGMQLGLIFHSHTDGSRGTYSNQIYATFDASLNVSAFRRAWEKVVQRHPILRTSFGGMDLEQPLQSVARQVELPWTQIDLAGGEGPDADAAFETRRQSHKAEPFALERAPLMRFLLVTCRHGRVRFCWTYHHCLLDGWSVLHVWRELALAYQAATSEVDAQLPTVQPFENHVRWLLRQDDAAARAFWGRQLEGFRYPTRLLSERRHPKTHASAPGASQIRWALAEDRTRALSEAARSHRVTLAAMVLGAWAVLLQRRSGQDDVVFGVTTSGRGIDLDGVDGIVGLLINTIPARVIGHELREPGVWLRALQAGQAEREANAFLSLAEIRRCSPLAPGESLFDTAVVFENYAAERCPSSGLPVSGDLRFDEQTHFGLALLVIPGPRLSLEIGFDDSRFSAEDVSAMVQELNAILDTLSRVPETKAAVAGAQQSAMCRQGELRLGRYLVHQLVENHARSTPGKLAVSCGGRQLTYDELNRLANRIANGIAARFPDIGADDRIALVMPRNENLLICILAIWKLGAAYLPIDPKLPGGRVALMLQGAGVKLAIADPAALELHPIGDWGFACETLATFAGDTCASDDDPDIHVSGNDLAYIIYTSGSTGTPKGAMVEHIGALNNIANKIADFEVDAGSRVAQTASQSFDISVWQMFIALTRGASTFIYEDATVSNVERLWRSVNDDGVTVLELVPSYLVLLMEHLREQPHAPVPAALKYLVLTGESADATFIKEWFDRFPATCVVNAYGPTEASDDITHHVMTAADAITNPVPVGRALANFDVYVVDENLRPVPIGEKGEIVVTGVGVGRGYVNVPAGMTTAFRESPFPDKYRRRLYHTGDLGRMREDGLLVFLGRKDQQVKVRGFRIELEEIEVTLRENPAVRQCVVLAVGQSPQDSRLCACVVPYGEPDKQALIDDLARKLPEYMIPADFRFMPELPVLANGKVDRAALLQLQAAPAARAPYRAPAGPFETRLAAIWEEVLRTERIGLDDDFFELGGDSFKAIRIAAKFGSPLEVADIYNGKTIAATCAALAARGEQESRLSALIGKSADSTIAIVGVSQSGGDPVSFFAVAQALRQSGGRAAFLAVKLPRRPADGPEDLLREVDQIADEVCDELAALQLPVILYAQCNGSALGIRLAQKLARLGRPARAFIVGGALFRTDLMPADGRSDDDILEFLTSIGSTLPDDPAELAFFLSDFRYDCAMASAVYNQCIIQGADLDRIGAPVFSIAGTNDPVVRGYQQHVSNWKRLSDQVTLIEYEGQGHYLLRDCPERVAATIKEVIDAASG